MRRAGRGLPPRGSDSTAVGILFYCLLLLCVLCGDSLLSIAMFLPEARGES